MTNRQATIAEFSNRESGERTVERLVGAGFEMKTLSLVGKGYRCEEARS